MQQVIEIQLKPISIQANLFRIWIFSEIGISVSKDGENVMLSQINSIKLLIDCESILSYILYVLVKQDNTVQIFKTFILREEISCYKVNIRSI